jgi:hypothetical protein
MQPNCVKKNLLHKVRYTGNKEEMKDGLYVFTGATLRRRVNPDGTLGDFYYDAELQDPRCNHSIITVYLSEIEPIGEGQP